MDPIEAVPDTKPDIELCPNPWTLIFVAENGTVSICFCAHPIGNIYEMPLIDIWNSQKAIGFRSNIVNGRYLKAGCSELWCSWREGKHCTSITNQGAKALMMEFRNLVNYAISNDYQSLYAKDIPSYLKSIRRAFSEKEQRIQELQATLVDLCDKNQSMLEELDRQRMAMEDRYNNLAAQTNDIPFFDLTYEYYKTTFIEISKFRLKPLLDLMLMHTQVFARGFRVLKHRLREHR